MLEMNEQEMMNQASLEDLETQSQEALTGYEYGELENMVDQIFENEEIDEIYENPMPENNSTTADELENFEPTEGNDTYDAGDAMEHWEFQGDTNRCGQFSQLFVIEEMTGLDLDPDTFCEFSQQQGWFDEYGGTAPEDLNKMLDYFGIENEISQGNDLDSLLECLENGGRAIVALDSGEYWDGEDATSDILEPYGADHAVEVIGFDAEKNCVILNDSGSPDGCGEEVPLDTFSDAWEDSGNLMVECYAQ
ncbi:MAG: hypothetical protein IJG23_07440 [Clostridia bacterium]|nr:hypothetical protein [Clostridia bacterium]